MNIFNRYKKPIENLQKYIDMEYGEKVKNIDSSLIYIPSITIKNYEGKNICTLVSMSKLINFYSFSNREDKINEIFKYVYDNAYLKGYHPVTGTYPLFYKRIFKKTLEDLDIDNLEMKNHLFLNFDLIKENIGKNNPLMLSFYSGYYKKHTVVCNGYALVKTDKNIRKFLIVADGWKNTYRYIDIDRINKLFVIGQSFIKS